MRRRPDPVEAVIGAVCWAAFAAGLLLLIVQLANAVRTTPFGA